MTGVKERPTPPTICRGRLHARLETRKKGKGKKTQAFEDKQCMGVEYKGQKLEEDEGHSPILMSGKSEGKFEDNV